MRGRGSKLERGRETGDGDRGETNGRRYGDGATCSLKPGSHWVGGGQVANISTKTGVAELARASRRKLLKRSLPSPPFNRLQPTPQKPSRFSTTHVEGTSQPSQPSNHLSLSLSLSDIQFHLGQVPVPSTRWLNLQTNLLCVRERARKDE